MIFAYGGAVGRLAEYMGVSICFPYGEQRAFKYRRNVVRDRKLRAVINVGCALNSLPGGVPVVNRHAINAKSKRGCFERFDKAGVPRPDYVNPRHAKAPYLARFDGLFDGRGITICQPGDPVPMASFYVELLPYKAEYRVHPMRRADGIGYETILVQNRVVPATCQSPIHDWHRSRCYLAPTRAESFDPMLYHNLSSLAYRALDALNMDFGGVDILETPDGRLYVLEVNSAPACCFDRETVHVYGDAFLARWADV